MKTSLQRYHGPVVLFAVLAVMIGHAGSFSVGRLPVRLTAAAAANRRQAAITALSAAGLFETAAYLNGLSPPPPPVAPRSATEAYLSSLSRLADESSGAAAQSATATSPEAYLHSVSQFASSSSGSGTFHLADAAVEAPQQATTTTAATTLTEIDNAAAGASFVAATADDGTIVVPASASEATTTTTTTSSLVDSAVPDPSALVTPSSTSSSSDSLATQLSGLSYESLVGGSEKAVSSGGGGISLLQQQPPPPPAVVAVDVSGASPAVPNAALLERWSSAREATATQIGKLWGQASQAAQAVADATESTTTQVSRAGSTTVQNAVGEKSVAELADSVLAGLQTVGRTLLAILDNFLDAVGGTSVANLVANAQSSVQGVVDGVVQSVVATVNGIGEMSVADAARNLVALIVVVAKVLFGILNAVVTVLSGRAVSEWALTARATVEQEAGRLTAQAGAAATDLSQKSLSELGTLVSGFTQDVGRLMVESAGSALGSDSVINSGSQLVDSLSTVMASSQVESASTAVSALPF